VGRSLGPGRSLLTTLPYIGYSSEPVVSRGLPVSQYSGAWLWSPGLFSVLTLRITVYLSARFAISGSSSPTCNPVTFD